jgi:hypothetical protein
MPSVTHIYTGRPHKVLNPRSSAKCVSTLAQWSGGPTIASSVSRPGVGGAEVHSGHVTAGESGVGRVRRLRRRHRSGACATAAPAGVL